MDLDTEALVDAENNINTTPRLVLLGFRFYWYVTRNCKIVNGFIFLLQCLTYKEIYLAICIDMQSTFQGSLHMSKASKVMFVHISLFL